MKNKIYAQRLVVLPVFLLLVSGQLFSQGTDSRTLLSKQKNIYVGALVSFSSTSIGCEEILNVDSPGSIGKMAAGGAIDFAWFFKPFAGISLGAGFSSYSQSLVLDSYETNLPGTDSENEPYEMQITGSSISERQKIMNVVLPVSLILRMQMTERLGLFVKGGIQCEIPVVRSFNGSGDFTYNGYYAQYPVILEGLPEYGFPSNLETDVTGDMPIKSFCTSMIFSVGISVNLASKIQMILSADLSKSISDISGKAPNPDYRITTMANEYNSLIGGSTKTGLKAIGFGLGFRYFLDKD